MKQLIISALTTVFIVTSGYGQWNESDFTPTGMLYELEFPALNSAYITEGDGRIYKSTDAGNSWSQIYAFSPFSNLTDPNFMNADTGFVSANSGVFRTFDGGISWSGISISWGQTSGVPISRIKVTGEKIYSTYVSNDTIYFIRSDNYGTTWNTVFENYEENAQAYHFSMLDALNGYFVNPNELEQVLKTSDGGLTFSDTIFVTNGDMVPQAKYDFKDMQNGYWYGSAGSLSHPTRTWNTGTFYFPVDLDGFGVLPVLDLDFNTSKLYACTLYGKLFYSVNNGFNWIEQATPLSEPIISIAFADENHGIAVSNTKVIFTNNDGTVGIEESPSLPSSINIYPNPASDFITIESTDLKILKVSIIDVDGKTVSNIFNPSVTLNTTELKAGIYFLHIESARGKLTKKVIIE